MAGQASDGDTLTRADAQAWLRQFPFPGWAALGLHALSVLAGNGVVLWLLQSGRLPGAGLILLVVLEFILLMVLARLLAWPVPHAQWFEPPQPWRKVLPLFAFLAVWAGGAYAITLVMIDGWGDFLAFFRDPSAWHRTGLGWALGITATLAVVGGLGDLLRWKRRGPPYMSSLSMDTMARLLTLIFGAIPFAVPFFVVGLGGIKGVEYLAKRARVDPGQSLLAGVAALAVAAVAFQLVGWLIASGVTGWALGYVLAKCLSELLVVAVPLVMREAAAGR